MENDILKKRVTEQALSYKAVVVPDILKESLMILAHDEQGHNGFKRTYNALKNPVLLERNEETHPAPLQEM